MPATAREDPYHNDAPFVNAISASQHPPPGGDPTKDLIVQWRPQTHQCVQFITQSHEGSWFIRQHQCGWPTPTISEALPSWWSQDVRAWWGQSGHLRNGIGVCQSYVDLGGPAQWGVWQHTHVPHHPEAPGANKDNDGMLEGSTAEVLLGMEAILLRLDNASEDKPAGQAAVPEEHPTTEG